MGVTGLLPYRGCQLSKNGLEKTSWIGRLPGLAVHSGRNYFTGCFSDSCPATQRHPVASVDSGSAGHHKNCI